MVTIADLEALNPLKGVADQFHETLKPRESDHLIVINAQGTLESGQSFRFHVLHKQDETKSIRIEISNPN